MEDQGSGENKVLSLLIEKGAIPTNAKRLRCHLAQSAVYPRCDADNEDVDHIFRCCPKSRSVWASLSSILPTLAGHMDFDLWFSELLQHEHNNLLESCFCGGHGVGGTIKFLGSSDGT